MAPADGEEEDEDAAAATPRAGPAAAVGPEGGTRPRAPSPRDALRVLRRRDRGARDRRDRDRARRWLEREREGGGERHGRRGVHVQDGEGLRAAGAEHPRRQPDEEASVE